MMVGLFILLMGENKPLLNVLHGLIAGRIGTLIFLRHFQRHQARKTIPDSLV